MALVTDPNEIRRIAQEAKIVAVVGMSKKTERSSYLIAEQIRNQYAMYYINPVYAGQKVFGELIVSSLRNVPQHIDIVDVFRNHQYVSSVIEEAIAVSAKVVWLQPGSESYDVIEKYKDDIDLVAHACLGVVARHSI